MHEMYIQHMIHCYAIMVTLKYAVIIDVPFSHETSDYTKPYMMYMQRVHTIPAA